MKVDEVTHWNPFIPEHGDPVDLSFLDAHWVYYVEPEGSLQPGKVYKFFITYSFHCFAKAYEHQTEEEKRKLMYVAPNDQRPFCYKRYELAKTHLKNLIENLATIKIFHAGYGSYASAKIIGDNGDELWYFVPFSVFKEQKMFRIHVTSAYILDTQPGGSGGKVKFFSIARNLSQGKPLPKPRGR